MTTQSKQKLTIHHELIALFGVAVLIVVISQFFDQLNSTLVSLLVVSYWSANLLVGVIQKQLNWTRLVEFSLVALILWVVLLNII